MLVSPVSAAATTPAVSFSSTSSSSSLASPATATATTSASSSSSSPRQRRWVSSSSMRMKQSKRPLVAEQLQGSSSTATTTKAKATGTTTTTSPSTSTGGSGGGGGGGGGMKPTTSGGSSLLPLGVVALAALGGGGYYYYTNFFLPEQEAKKKSTTIIEEESGVATTPAVVEQQQVDITETTVESTLVDQKEGDAEAEVSTMDVKDDIVDDVDISVIEEPIEVTMDKEEVLEPEKATLPSTTEAAAAADDVEDDAAKAAAAAPPIDDPSITSKALLELRESKAEEAAASLLKTHQSTWTEMDAEFFADLDTLNQSQLKARIVQLATEMKDRTRWEAVRLKEFLSMKDKETTDQFMDAMQKQKLEFEALLARRLREKEDECIQQMNKALRDKETTIQNVIKTALEAQQAEHDADKKFYEETMTVEIHAKLDEEYGNKLEEIKKNIANDLQQKVTTLASLTEKLKNLESALEASESSKRGSSVAHKLSAAALALSEKLETNQSASAELKALGAVSSPGGVIATAIATIPPTMVETGVPTLPELQAQFDDVNASARQAALVPVGRPGLEGQLAGMLFASLKFPPNPSDEDNNITTTTTTTTDGTSNNAEYILARAKKYVHVGELEHAIEQLDMLPNDGQVALTVKDWKQHAMNRITVDKALKVIKMECALLNESLANEE